jgi:hypothetical protein
MTENESKLFDNVNSVDWNRPAGNEVSHQSQKIEREWKAAEKFAAKNPETEVGSTGSGVTMNPAVKIVGVKQTTSQGLRYKMQELLRRKQTKIYQKIAADETLKTSKVHFSGHLN